MRFLALLGVAIIAITAWLLLRTNTADRLGCGEEALGIGA